MTNNSTNKIHILQQALAKHFAESEARLKQSLPYFLPFYQGLAQAAPEYLNQSFFFQLNAFYQSAALYLRLVPSTEKKILLNLQIHSPINIDIDLVHHQITQALTLLIKINHEYGKILTPTQIKYVDLLKLSHKKKPASWVIEQQIMLDFSKQSLERWLWLLDHFLNQLYK